MNKSVILARYRWRFKRARSSWLRPNAQSPDDGHAFRTQVARPCGFGTPPGGRRGWQDCSLAMRVNARITPEVVTLIEARRDHDFSAAQARVWPLQAHHVSASIATICISRRFP
jgi:hypothetical protein